MKELFTFLLLSTMFLCFALETYKVGGGYEETSILPGETLTIEADVPPPPPNEKNTLFFVARLKSQKEKQVFETANRIESKIAGEGFEVHRLKKPEIKRILALYFEASMQGEAIPDIDGEQFYEGTDDEDEE